MGQCAVLTPHLLVALWKVHPFDWLCKCACVGPQQEITFAQLADFASFMLMQPLSILLLHTDKLLPVTYIFPTQPQTELAYDIECSDGS